MALYSIYFLFFLYKFVLSYFEYIYFRWRWIDWKGTLWIELGRGWSFGNWTVLEHKNHIKIVEEGTRNKSTIMLFYGFRSSVAIFFSQFSSVHVFLLSKYFHFSAGNELCDDDVAEIMFFLLWYKINIWDGWQVGFELLNIFVCIFIFWYVSFVYLEFCYFLKDSKHI